MKKKWIAVLLLAAMTWNLTACGSSTETSTAGESSSASSATDAATDETKDVQAQMQDLMEQENAIIAEHQELWNTVFNNIDKSKAEQSTENNYGAFLELQLEHVKDQFSDEDLKKLEQDITAIKELEDQLAALSEQSGESITADTASSNSDGTAFPTFQAKDLDGNDVDSSIFSQHAVTVVNFWFNGCSPCVEELPALNELNESLKAQGGAVIGVNTDSLDGNEDGIAEAKQILEKQGVAYQNIYFDSSSEAGQYASNIMAFPTTIFVDRNGTIIGEPILGGMDNEEVREQAQKTIDEIVANDTKQ